jgi:hypothetical protein
MDDIWTPAERALIKELFIAFKRAWQADPGSAGEDGQADIFVAVAHELMKITEEKS